VNEYEYPPETMALNLEGVKFFKTRSDTQSLQMLARSRLNAAIVITNDMQPRNQKARDAKIENKVQFAFNCGHETGSIGFSLKHEDGLWAYKTYEEGYSRIKKRGELKRIGAKWFSLTEKF